MRVEISNLIKEIQTLQAKKRDGDTSSKALVLINEVDKLKKADSEKTSTITHLKQELAKLQGVTEVIKTQCDSGMVSGGSVFSGSAGVLEKDSVQRRGGGEEKCGWGYNE